MVNEHNSNHIYERIRHLKKSAFQYRNLIFGFLSLSGMRVVQIALGLITTYFLTRALSVHQYGEYQFLLNVIGILSIFSLTEFNNTLMQSIARGHMASYRKMLPWPFLGSLISSLILLCFSFYYGYFSDHSALMAGFSSAAIFIPFIQGLILWRGVKIGKHEIPSYSFIESLGMVVTQLSILVMIWISPGSYIPVLVAFLIVPTALNAFMFWRMRGLLHVKGPPEPGIISHGFYSSLYISSSTLSLYIDKILLFFFLSPTALAFFVAADRITDLLRSGVQDLATSFAPHFAKTAFYSARFDRISKIFCFFLGAGLVLFAFTGLPHVILLIYGEPYRAAIPYAQALIFAVAFGNLASIQFRYVRSKLDTKNVRYIVISTAVAKIILSLFLIPLFGINGAVISSLAHRILLSVMTNRMVKSLYMEKAAVLGEPLR